MKEKNKKSLVEFSENFILDSIYSKNIERYWQELNNTDFFVFSIKFIDFHHNFICFIRDKHLVIVDLEKYHYDDIMGNTQTKYNTYMCGYNIGEYLELDYLILDNLLKDKKINFYKKVFEYNDILNMENLFYNLKCRAFIRNTVISILEIPKIYEMVENKTLMDNNQQYR